MVIMMVLVASSMHRGQLEMMVMVINDGQNDGRRHNDQRGEQREPPDRDYRDNRRHHDRHRRHGNYYGHDQNQGDRNQNQGDRNQNQGERNQGPQGDRNQGNDQ